MKVRAIVAVPLAVAAMAAVAVPVLRRIRPQAVPRGLAEGVFALEVDGWTVASWHSLWCRDRAPHVHVFSPGGMGFVLFESGKVKLPGPELFRRESVLCRLMLYLTSSGQELGRPGQPRRLMKINIEREQPTSGGPSRTNREEMAPIFDGEGKDGEGIEAEPEEIVDVSPSLAWPWDLEPSMMTWNVLVPSVKGTIEPFAAMDSQAAAEQARAGANAAIAAGGVAMFPFSNRHLPFSDRRDDEGELIIDANPANFDERWLYFLSLYPQYFENGLPTHGGTEVMTAVAEADKHFMGEFGNRPRGARPKRPRMLHTDGLLKDAKAFRRYLSDAQPLQDKDLSTHSVLGQHGEWDEAWIVAIYGPEGGEPREAYQQYVEIARDHPWIHPVYFSNVMNAEETSEDIAYLAVPVNAA